VNSAISLVYLAASVLFILGIRGLTHPRTAVRGNLMGATGMLLAVAATLLDRGADASRRGGPLHLEPLAYAAMGPAPGLIEPLTAKNARIGIHLAAALLDRLRVLLAVADDQASGAGEPAACWSDWGVDRRLVRTDGGLPVR